MKDVFAIILCGGSGSRLWPRSRSSHPKHLLQLNGGATLVQETVRRLDLPLERIFCITEASHADLLREQLPDIPEANVVVEPDRRGSASAIALALDRVKQLAKPETVIMALPADQLINDETAFQATIAAWANAARRHPKLVTLGIRPTYPSTGFGYINQGQLIDSQDGFEVFAVKQFVEKPDEATARTYIEKGNYLWNAGQFAATLKVFEQEMTEHQPELMKTVDGLSDADDATIKERYLKLPTETIDYGVIEKSANLAVVPASFGWADVGSWADLHDVLERDAEGNVFEGEYIDIDSKECFVYSPDQLVATIGLSNLVIINTGDAVLICPKDRSQDVKKVVEELKRHGYQKYL